MTDHTSEAATDLPGVLIQSNTTLTAPISAAPSPFEQIRARFHVLGADTVYPFLETHPHLLPLLLEAHSEIEHYFPGCEVRLEVFADREVADWVQLVATIIAQGSPEDILALYHRFQQAWWVPNLRRAQGALVVMPDYP